MSRDNLEEISCEPGKKREREEIMLKKGESNKLKTGWDRDYPVRMSQFNNQGPPVILSVHILVAS